jgi:predicted HAD superfamily Cof-like phosphohydrolase
VQRQPVEALAAMNPQDWVTKVAQFQRERMLLDLPQTPTTDLDAGQRADLIGLLYEESREVQKALVAGDNLEKVVDGCADIIYIAINIALQHGVDITPHFEEVHAANMEKAPASGGFGRMTKDGKSTKADWSEPRIADILQAQQK